jgi:hypothetical protein
MFRHPYYLDIPWNLHWHHGPNAAHHHLWWLIAVLAFLAIFLIGVGVTSGTLSF